jgi:hypothetical protein
LVCNLICGGMIFPEKILQFWNVALSKTHVQEWRNA